MYKSDIEYEKDKNSLQIIRKNLPMKNEAIPYIDISTGQSLQPNKYIRQRAGLDARTEHLRLRRKTV